jgi:hypothetical protein
MGLGAYSLLFQCSSQDARYELQGTWRLDSIYSYYNGFTFTRKDIQDEPLQHYEPDGSLIMTLKEESRTFYFSMPVQDSLIHLAPDKSVIEKFQVVELSNNVLALKKVLNPVFKGPQQERYEVRYFSKVD